MERLLINGDCSLIRCNDVIKAINGRLAIIVTDPPFNIGYHYNSYKDNKDEAEYFSWLGGVFGNYPLVVVHYPEAMYKLAFALGRQPERVISWVYNSNTARQHRDIAFFGVKPDMKQVRQPYKNPNDKRIKERIARGCEGAKLYDWWEVNQVKNVSKEKTDHPCQMPIEVMNRVIGILPKNCVVIDPFMGSGTTGVAVENMNAKQNADRSFIGIEEDPTYYKIAERRLYYE